MDTIDTLKKDLAAAKNLKQIVSTMKALAATNIKKYEKVASNLFKYLGNVHLGLQAMIHKNPEMVNIMDEVEKSDATSEDAENVVVVIGSNQGLCGRYNDKIVDFFVEDLKVTGLMGNSHVISLGDRIESMLLAKGVKINDRISIPNSIENIVHIVYYLFNVLEDFISKSKSINVFIYFTQYDSKSNGILTKSKILPLEKKFFEGLAKKKWPTNNVPYWRLDTEELFSEFIKQYIFGNVYFAIANSMATEQKNRLMTLQGAEQNIKDSIANITLKYNQTRQGIITSELIDVVSGYKASKRKK